MFYVFVQNVMPDPDSACGPYAPAPDKTAPKRSRRQIDPHHVTGEPDHDTICQIAISEGPTPQVVVGTTTNGLDHKIPG